jgi:hypothetical protein
MGDAEDFTIHFGAVCPHCSYTLESFETVSEAYFSGTQILCSNAECAKPIDYWDSTLEVLADGQMHPALKLILLGARQTLFRLQVPPSVLLEVNLEKYGVPADATILA